MNYYFQGRYIINFGWYFSHVKKSCKKFYCKFSDYVWGFSMKKGDDKPWNKRVKEAMTLAYKAGKINLIRNAEISLKDVLVIF